MKKLSQALSVTLCSLTLLSVAQADHRRDREHHNRHHNPHSHHHRQQHKAPAKPKQRPAHKRRSPSDHDKHRHELLVHLDERIHFARRHKLHHLAAEWQAWRRHVYRCNDFRHSHAHYWDRHYAKRDYHHYRRARRYYHDHYPRRYLGHYYGRHHYDHHRRYDRRGRRFSSVDIYLGHRY